MIQLGQSHVIQKKGKYVNIGTRATVKIMIANIPIPQKIAIFISVEISAEVVNVESGTDKCVGTGMTRVATGKINVPICIKKPSQKKGEKVVLEKVKETEATMKKVKESEETVMKVKETEDTVQKVKETGETVQKVRETEEIVKKVKETEETVKIVKEAMEAETVETEYLKAVTIAVTTMW